MASLVTKEPALLMGLDKPLAVTLCRVQGHMVESKDLKVAYFLTVLGPDGSGKTMGIFKSLSRFHYFDSHRAWRP